MVDPIRRQLLFDFERAQGKRTAVGRRRSRCAAPAEPSAASRISSWPRCRPRRAAKSSAPSHLYEEILAHRSRLRRGLHQSRHHLLPSAPVWPRRGALPPRHRSRSRATCWRSSIWATCWTSWSGWTSPSPRTAGGRRSRPRYADAHYNLALAYERKGRTAPGAAPLAGLSSGSTTTAPGPTMRAPDPQAAQPRKARHRLAHGPVHAPTHGNGVAGCRLALKMGPAACKTGSKMPENAGFPLLNGNGHDFLTY